MANFNKPRLLKGSRDILPEDLVARQRMIETIRAVYERYGFIPLETPALEYVDVLGKYLPETDVPEGGIFAFRLEGKWVALRYDLTAPLSRVVALYKELPRPFRRYQVGPVWRKEKPGPGRFREFYQMDFDSVGVPGMIADAEACCIIADTLEALGIARGDYIVRVNNRKILNGVLEKAGIISQISGGEPSQEALNVLRAIDKLERVGLDGVRQLLGEGRKDESGDFTPGVGLKDKQIAVIENYLSIQASSRVDFCTALEELLNGSRVGIEGVREMQEIDVFLREAGYAEDRVVFDPTVVRGLTYYTGPVFEAVLTFEITDSRGIKRRFGSVFGGGRYDDLIQRFTGEKVPATGASIGVDRLLSALKHLGKITEGKATAPVLVTIMDSDRTPEYHAMAVELRQAGINTELYVGCGDIREQLKYADQSGKVVAVIVGERERARGEVSLKDLQLGRELAKEVTERAIWLQQQPAQVTVPRIHLVEEVKKILDRYQRG